MDSSFLLILLLVTPLAGAVIGGFLSDAAAKGWALVVSLATFGVSVWLAMRFFAGADLVVHPPSAPAQLTAIGASFSLGVTHISVWLILLTTFLQPLAILSSFKSVTIRQREYYAWINALLVAMLGVFVARDLLLFYVFFELTLIPMFFIIGIWGGPERRHAATKFFLFTFAGGVLTLAAAVYVGMAAGTFALDDWGAGALIHKYSVIHYAQLYLTPTARWWVMCGLLAGFAVKTPLFPVHTWLPLAHTEAPTAGSVILAGVLLKLGTYGLFILAVPIGLIGQTDSVIREWTHFIAIICIIGIIYGALCAWVQPDIKKLVAFSSVSHLGFCVLGLFALNDIGMQGSVLYMINHGLSTGAMFLVIGMIYDRYHTRDINKLSGLAANMPVLSFFFIFFTLSSIGLPGLNGFVSEFLTTLGAFTSPYLNPWYGSVAAIGIILGAVYMLHMAARVIMGPLKVPDVDHGDNHDDAHGHGHGHGLKKNDIGFREVGILIPLAIVVIIIGVKPGIILNGMRTQIEELREAPVVPMAQKITSPANAAVAQADVKIAIPSR
ncbi:MAG TPA: NADH-quinone oxidoreductase subunit M [Tepidisphaeraceae bacterium]|jgi:NADH-quinone oxidoreductase subunit M|nr:NADH-quinone oxidoreductase subunit M [Tepidisphaeraceae bacterium]